MHTCVFIFILTILSSATLWADQIGRMYVHPSLPSYSMMDRSQLEILEPNMQTEFIRFVDRREMMQRTQFVEVHYDNALNPKDSFLMRRMFDRTLSRITSSNYFKKTSIGKTAESVRQQVDTDMKFSLDEKSKHKFDFKVAVLQRQAILRYSGLANAQLRYDLRNGGSFAAVYRHDFSPNNFMGFENIFTGDLRGQFITLNFLW